jgi:hypothetical protein
MELGELEVVALVLEPGVVPVRVLEEINLIYLEPDQI